MDKLRELLSKAGVSEELIDGICEEFETLSATLKEERDQELANKIQRAKQIFIEEIAREKAAIARKVKVFLESKARSFEEAAARQRRVDESESAAKLRRAVEILTDGQNVVGEDVGQSDADRKLISRLEKALTSVREERDNALLRAKRAYGIADGALKRNQFFETKLRDAGLLEWEEGEEPWAKKGGDAKKAKAKTDETVEADAECNEDVKKDEKVRLSEGRKAKAKSRAAQPVLKESQTKTPAKSKTTSDSNADPEISRIAGLIPDRE